MSGSPRCLRCRWRAIRGGGLFQLRGRDVLRPTRRSPPVAVLRKRSDGAGRDTQSPPNVLQLPFDFSEVIENLQQERYRRPSRYAGRSTAGAAAKFFYYFLRPGLSVAVRKHLQRLRLRGWERIAFPQWPVDNTVETLMDGAMRLLLEGSGASSIPFIWFWPDGARSCVMMTHDVEGPSGPRLLRRADGPRRLLRDQVGLPARPESMEGDRLGDLAARCGSRGFEVNLHDLNHDGYLFHNRKEFRAAGRRGSMRMRASSDVGGFAPAPCIASRTGSTRSISPTTCRCRTAAHLEPQRGGCCTVMPYFIGRHSRAPADDGSGLLVVSHPRQLFDLRSGRSRLS